MLLISRSFAMFVIALIALPFMAFAQDPSFPNDEPFENPFIGQDNLFCQAFLNSSSIQVFAQPTVSETVSGAEMIVTGTVQNATQLLLDNMTLHAFVFEQSGDIPSATDRKVDQFVIEDDLSLEASAASDIEYDWVIPSTLQGGTYYIEHYVMINDRYAIAGEPFSDRQSINRVTFDVIAQGDLVEFVSFGDAVAVNGVEYNRGDVAPVDFSGMQTVTATVVNPTDEVKIVPVEWQQYAYTSLSEDNLINTEVQIVTIDAGETVDVEYTLQSHEQGWGQVVGFVQDKQSKSYIDVQYQKSDMTDGQVLATGLTKESDTLYGLHACAVGPIEGVLTTVVTDTSGNEIFSKSSQIETGFPGLLEEFSLPTGAEINSVVSTLKLGDEIVDEYVLQFATLDDIGSEVLPTLADDDKSVLESVLTVVALIVLLFIIVIIFVIFKKKFMTKVSADESMEDNNGTPISMLFLPLLVTFGMILWAPQVHAGPGSASASTNYLETNAFGDGNFTIYASANGPSSVTPGQTFSVQLRAGCAGDDGSGTRSVYAYFNGSGSPSYSGACPLGATPVVENRSITAPTTPGTYNITLWAGMNNPPTWPSYVTQPAVTGTYTYTVTAPANQAPSISISGPTSGTANTSIVFTFNGTDPDGDQVRYHIDWNGDGVADSVTGWLNSGQNRLVSYNLPSSGTVVARARAEDSNGAFSGWDSHSVTVTSPPSSGSVNGSGCTIAVGNSTCVGNVSWSLSGSCAYVFNHGTGVLVSSGASSGNQSLNLAHGLNRVVGITQCLAPPQNYYTAFSIDDVLLNATCAAGSSWDGSRCVANTPAPSGSINGSGCTIPGGSSVCNGSFSWNFSNASLPRIINTTNGNSLHHVGLTVGTSQPVPLTFGNNLVGAYDNTQLLNFTTVNASCAAGSAWNGSSCYVNPPTNNPPTAPNITGNSNGTTGVSGPNLTFVSTDPDGDQIRYDVDFDGNGSIDISLPQFAPSGFTNSGQAETYSNTWSSAGLYTVRARAVDDQGTVSGWATYDVSISGPTPSACSPAGSSFTWNNSTGQWTPDGSNAGWNWDLSMIGVSNTTAPSSIPGAFAGAIIPYPMNVDLSVVTVVPGTGSQFICGGTVLPPVPNATVSGTGCLIAAGANTCTGTASWDIRDSVAFNVWNDTTGQSYSTAGYGLNEPVTLQYGNNEIWAMGTQVPPITPSSQLPLAVANVVASCSAGTVWDGSVCASAGPTSCDPNGSWWHWNGVNWDDFGVGATPVNWTPWDVGVAPNYTTAPGAWSAPVSVGLGVTWESQNILRCGTAVTPAPGITFTINGSASSPVTVNTGDDLRIEWSTTDTTSCTASGAGWNGSVGLTGDTGNPSSVTASGGGTQPYVLTCTGPGGTSFEQIDVDVIPPPPPTADVSVTIGSGAPQTGAGPYTMNSSDSLTISWNSSNFAGNCSATTGNFTANGTSGSASPTTLPTPGGPAVTYTIDCGGATDSIQVNMSAQPNLTTPVINRTLGTFDMATGMYSSVNFTVSSPSDGDIAVPSGEDFELTFTGGIPTLTGTLSGANVGSSASGNVSTPNVMFGNYSVTIRVDQNGSLVEKSETDNSITYPLTIPIVDPGITIDADRIQVRNGDRTMLRWDTVATFPMQCDVIGPGISVPTFNPNNPLEGPTGDVQTGFITAKAEYTLRCEELTTNTVFTDTATVETVGEVEER